MASLRTHFRRKTLLILIAVGAGSCLRTLAQDQNQAPELTQDTQDVINEKIRPESDAKQWDKVLVDLDGILAKVPADSYDAALMYKLKAQAYLNLGKSDYAGALDSLRRSLAISDRHPNYFKPKETLESVYYVAQLTYQEAASSKDPKKQQEGFKETLEYLDRWIKGSSPQSLTQDNYQFIATVYFTLGQGFEIGGQQKADPAMLAKAVHWIDLGLQSAVHPRDVFYQLKIAALFQLNRLQEGADYLELRLRDKPDNKSYWQQLAATYIQLADTAQKAKNNQAYFDDTVRAILTMERAQKLGFLTSPKENFQLVGMYFNINQFDRACDLLEAGLKGGTIESTEQNWELLAYSYQQQHKDQKAIESLEYATKLFPKTGPIEYQIAQIYFGINREKDAFEHIKLCVAHGGTEKPHVAWLFYAYLGLDLKHYDEALKAAQQAAKYPEAAAEAKRMEDAIKASMQDEANRKSSR